MTSQNGESLHSSFKQPDLSNESSTLQPSFSFNTPQNITSNPELSSSLSGPRLQADRTVNTSSTASIDDIVDELLTQHQLPSAQPRTESDLREENTRLIQALTLLRKRNAYLKEREITLLKSQSQLRENQTQFSELQAQVAQRALELQTREKALESEREQLQQREQILAQREEYLKQWQTRLEQTEKQLEERLTQTQREWNAKHEELEALKIQQKEQLQEREEELNFLRQQLEQKEKMLDLQLQHYKLQVEQAKEKEQVLKKRQEMLDKQNEELKRRETNLTAKEREIEETSKDLQIKREHLTQLQQQLQQLQQQLQKQQLEKEVHLQEKAIEREKTETHELHSYVLSFSSLSPCSIYFLMSECMTPKISNSLSITMWFSYSTTKLLERLKTLEAQHTILENEYQKVITQLRKSEELNEILQARQVALENELDYLKKEIQSKNEQFAKLSNQLKDTRLLSSPQTSTKASHEKIIVSSTKPQSSKEKIRRLIEELDNLRLASQAHQTQNAFLSQTVCACVLLCHHWLDLILLFLLLHSLPKTQRGCQLSMFQK
jgi:chromosome segregation ATPase